MSGLSAMEIYDERALYFVVTAFVKIEIILGISGFRLPKNYSERGMGLKRVASAKAVCLRIKNALA